MPICQYIKTFILGISLGIERVKTSRVEGSEFQIWPFFDKTHHFDFDKFSVLTNLKGQTNFHQFLTFLP